MKNLSPTGELFEEFGMAFPGCELSHTAAKIGNATMHCFFSMVSSEELLGLHWPKISNFLALKFQSKINNDFERWNLYLFFLLAAPVRKELHYLIENDTFSSRKIVLVSGQSHDDIIKEHVLNTDISESDQQVSQSATFSYNTLIYDQISSIKAKRKVSEDIESSLIAIIEKIKRNNEANQS